jgi:hypothetical protein
MTTSKNTQPFIELITNAVMNGFKPYQQILGIK